MSDALRIAVLLALPLLLTASCGSPTAPTSTGLAGTVLRGPTTPVCATNQPCEAPFRAGFVVQRGSTRSATFQSDEQGHFEVRLSPGTYVVIPDDNAPIISPKSQTKEVTVGESGLTLVELHFDTGIR
jgi:hypothetical protein